MFFIRLLLDVPNADADGTVEVIMRPRQSATAAAGDDGAGGGVYDPETESDYADRPPAAGGHPQHNMDAGRMAAVPTCTALPQKQTADSGSSQNRRWC